MEWYGLTENKKRQFLAFQQTLKGFDGEITDAATGWQFLGAGNRTYNPSQRYFVSEDPAGDGYAFGGNNPIMNSDPSGNMPKWLGKIFKIANTTFNMGMNMTHSKFIQGIGRSLIWGGMGLSFGPTFAIGMAFAAPATLAFTSALKPANKGLQQASMITGRVYGGALFVAGLIALGAGIGEFAEGLLAALTNEAPAVGGGETAAVGGETAAAGGEVATDLLPTYDQAISYPVNEYEYEYGPQINDYIPPNEEELEEVPEDDPPSYVAATGETPGNGGSAAIDDIPAVRRGILGGGTSGVAPSRYPTVTTFSHYHLIETDVQLFLNAPIEDVTNIVDEGVYDELLQEYASEYYLRLGHTLLRPGGRLYVMMTSDAGDNWASTYADSGAAIFGRDNTGFIFGIEQIRNVIGNFGNAELNPGIHNVMLVFQKAY